MVVRGTALFLGAFTLLNCVGGIFIHGFDANVWWIRITALPPLLSNVLLGAVVFTLLAQGWRPVKRRWLRRVGAIVLATAVAFAIGNCIEFYHLVWAGRIGSWAHIPLSAVVVVTLGWIAATMLKGSDDLPTTRWAPLIGLVTFAGLCITLPLAQMFFFGTTDYRRAADVAVVLGARTYADGAASLALSDRVRTAVELYQQGLVSRLIFSGGPGDGDISEPEAMRGLAIQWGVPHEAILLDVSGVNTDVTVKNSAAIFAELNLRRVLVVSHAYHLPRIKLAYQRAGWDVRTVPARQTRRLRGEAKFVAREVVAIWAYYLRPIFG